MPLRTLAALPCLLTRSEGFQHEIAEVQRCLAAKALECPAYTHAEMVSMLRAGARGMEGDWGRGSGLSSTC